MGSRNCHFKRIIIFHAKLPVPCEISQLYEIPNCVGISWKYGISNCCLKYVSTIQYIRIYIYILVQQIRIQNQNKTMQTVSFANPFHKYHIWQFPTFPEDHGSDQSSHGPGACAACAVCMECHQADQRTCESGPVVTRPL
jgi:hypothetical protein